MKKHLNTAIFLNMTKFQNLYFYFAKYHQGSKFLFLIFKM